MFRPGNTVKVLKIIWFFAVSLLLGPFALWFMLLGKRRRRGLSADYLSRLSGLAAAFLAFGLFLFMAPFHWLILTGIYVGAAAATAYAIGRPGRNEFFRLAAPGRGGRELPLLQTLPAAAMALYPIIYILALIRNIGELESFSIHLPSDVYSDGLLWMLYATPLVILAGLAAWKAGLKPGLRMLIYFYASVPVVLVWIMVWEKADQSLLSSVYNFDREPLLFAYAGELRFRAALKWFFYGFGFLLGSGYLIGAARTSVFTRRALLLGMPSLLLYANLLFLLGDWNFYLAALREKLLEGHHYGLYRVAASAQLARVPNAYRAPHLLDELAELEYQSGHVDRAKTLLLKLVARCGGKPYYARLEKRAQSELRNLDRPARAPSGTAPSLDLPVIKQASYLDADWYALLSAVAFLQPHWTDLDLRKRLLDLSSTVQLRLPKVDNIPDLGPALRQLGVPYSACFLTTDRIKTALAGGKVPFMSLYSHWVPISGYDPGRDGFYYYSYRIHEDAANWFRNEDIDLFYHKPGSAFGGQEEKSRTRDFKYSLRKFIPARDLENHIVDIGGVGLILGDSLFASAPERQAAFLVEQGDLDYQDHDDYAGAAEAYRRAGDLFPVDQVLSRKMYLARRHAEFAGDLRDYRNLFREYPPAWMKGFGPPPEKARELAGKILDGKIGTYILMNWYLPPPPDTAPKANPAMDTALRIFTRLHEMEPEEPLYLDSLATLHWRIGDLAGSEKLYAEMAALYPFGNEYAMFQLAWVKFKLGKTGELPAILGQCKGFADEARYLTMRGAEALGQGRYRSAHRFLSKSLKLDKGIEETHALLADYYRRKGDDASADVHRRWLRRST